MVIVYRAVCDLNMMKMVTMMMKVNISLNCVRVGLGLGVGLDYLQNCICHLQTISLAHVDRCVSKDEPLLIGDDLRFRSDQIT